MENCPIQILLVEDDPDDADLLQEVLVATDTTRFELVRVGRLSEALRRLSQDHFDVVLLDLSLPDSSGLESFLRIHHAEPGVPVVVLTGLDDDRLSARAIQQGAQDYLIKDEVAKDRMDRAIRYAIERHRLLAETRNTSLVDELTGLYNRRGLVTVAGPLCKTANRLKKRLTLLFIDLDNLKWINDTLGHQEGDRALADTAGILRESFRESDVLARLGGDEFAVLALGVLPVGSPILAERLQDKVIAHNAHERRRYHLSLSVGMAHYDPERPCALQELLTRADALMYEQKRDKRRARFAVASNGCAVGPMLAGAPELVPVAPAP
jgi:diguanylate cyclase (GGDEF)-like protein